MIPTTKQHWLSESSVVLGEQLAQQAGSLKLSCANL